MRQVAYLLCIDGENGDSTFCKCQSERQVGSVQESLVNFSDECIVSLHRRTVVMMMMMTTTWICVSVAL